MAETSFWWTTDGTGDGKIGGYTRVDHSLWMEILAACCGKEGVAPGYGNALAAAANGANTVTVSTGGALVDGKPYNNSAPVNVNIPSASGAGNTRIDRVVLRADWAAQTVRITRIAGVDAATPSLPAITQDSGNVYDIPICQVLVNTAGAVTVTDERVMADVPTTGIENNAVTNPKLRDSSALSVIGRASNSSGDPADIVASANDRLLARVSNALSWVQLTIGMIPDRLITEAKLAAAVAAKLVTNGNNHDHSGGDGAQINHANLANKGSNTHAQIDGHISATSAHSATSSATANRLILRDASGRAKVAAPSASDDIARKDTVDAVSSALNTHKSSADHDGRYYTESEANARFAPMAHDHVGGDGATLTHQAMANRTRSFFVPAQPGELGADPREFGAEPGNWAGVKLPDGIASQAVGYAAVPEDFVSDMQATPCYVPGATGSAVCVWRAHYCADGETIGLHTHGQDWLALSGTPLTMRIANGASLSLAAKGDVISFVFTRFGDDALDTMEGYLYLIGWRVTYTADM
jgi:hypothetical protein